MKNKKKKSNTIFIDGKVIIKVIMNCRTTSAQKLTKKLGFKQYDVILTKKTINAKKNKNII